ncbi:MAG: aldose 1-epimerase family protein, partial [Planctomycetota bacterium]|nr:aldose 1-epimerase family protein [Planctomycetota bacterium]
IAVAGSAPQPGSIEKYTLRGGVSDGVDVIEVDNGRFSFSILPTRGMGLWRGQCDGLDLGWQSPVALPVNPAFVNAHDRGEIGWLAGFNEWLCRCGLDANGPPGNGATLHGRIANIPAHSVRVSVDTDGPGTIRVTGVVDETMMFGPCLRLKSTIVTTLGSNSLTLIDEVTNLSAKPADLQLLYHTQFGPPVLGEGSLLELPATTVVPRDFRAAEGIDSWDAFRGPETGFAEQVYYIDLACDEAGKTVTLLRNAAGNHGVSLKFAKRDLPCFALWKNTQAEADGYCTGLEPATNFPNLKAYERGQGRIEVLSPGASRTFTLEIAVHSDADAVTGIQKQVADLLGGRPPLVHRSPQAGWSAAGG